MPDALRGPLAELAALWGVWISHTGFGGERVDARPESVLAVLKSLGAPLESESEAPAALDQAREDRWARLLEPVILCDAAGAATFTMRLGAGEAGGRVRVEIEPLDLIAAHPEAIDPGARRLELRPSDLRCVEQGGPGAAGRAAYEMRLPWTLEAGYHRMSVEAGGRRAEAVVLAAPASAPPWPGDERAWGVFLPLYAAWKRDGPAMGSFTLLGDLAEWAASKGASFLGTLPLAAAFLDQPFDPSPYSPASRLFLNELYVDPRILPELEASPEARALAERWEAPGVREGSQESSPLDYRHLYDRQRRILSALATSLAGSDGARAKTFREFVGSDPELAGYARFRAATDSLGRAWQEWPATAREGAQADGIATPSAVLYHEYAQWAAREQLDRAAARARSAGACLHLDFPLGVHPAGYDAWRWRRLFASGASAGAPPDSFFSGGQDWGFAPPRPARLREDGYRYFAMGLRRAMSCAGLLRIDHVMSMHRLFWVPSGAAAADGLYVSYPGDEMFSVVCLEARRSGCTIVGEDLGLVPDEVRDQMRRRSLLGIHVLQIEAETGAGRLGSPPREVVATLNTHDMPTFAAYWRGLDINDRRRLGHLDVAGAERESARRQEQREGLRRTLGFGPDGEAGEPEEGAALEACLVHLGRGASSLVQVNLEDLWLETRPHNVPGTTIERDNWRRRSRLSLEEIMESPRVAALLSNLCEARAATPRRNQT